MRLRASEAVGLCTVESSLPAHQRMPRTTRVTAARRLSLGAGPERGCIRCILYTAVWLYSLYTVYSGLLYAVYSIVKQCVAAVYRVYSGIQRTSYTAPPTAGSDAVGHDERPSPLHSHVWSGTVTIAAQRLSVVSFAIAMSIDSE